MTNHGERIFLPSSSPCATLTQPVAVRLAQRGRRATDASSPQYIRGHEWQ